MLPQPSIASLQCTLKVLLEQEILPFAIRLHVRICGLGLDAHHSIGNRLLALLSNTGSLCNAHKVFDKLPRDDFTWSTLIHGYNKHGHAQLALSLFQQMQDDHIEPNEYTFVALLKACAQLKDVKYGLELHAEAARKGFRADPYVGSILVDLYLKLGLIGKAQEVFNALSTHDLVTWTALIGGLADHGYGELALDYFEQMKRKGISPNAVTYACILKACGSTGNGEKGKELHYDILQRGLLKKSRIVGNTLLDMYGKCGMLAKAKKLFDELPDRDVVAWSTLISGYIDHDQNEQALKFFEKMKEMGISPNAFTYSCSLKACGNIGALGKGCELHDCILKEDLAQLNLFVGNALVDMYAKCGMLTKALEVFNKLPTHELVTWNALVTGYALLGEYDKVIAILDRMKEQCAMPNLVTFVSVLNVCSHAGLVEIGEAFYGIMCKGYQITPSLEHHTCMVDLFGRAGQLDKAVVAMRESIFHPNLVLWLTVLGACYKWENLDLGKQAFEQAILLDQKDEAAYVTMYNIYTRARLIDDAKQVEAMRSRVMMQT